MSWFLRAFLLSVGKKQLVAVTGLCLCLFLVGHLAGNFLLLAGPEAFDGYAAFLASKPGLLWPARAGLLLVFLVHLGLAGRVTLENWRARPVRYAVRATRGARTPASATMIYSGIVVLVFIILHLKHFTFGDRVEGSLYLLVISTFKKPAYMIWYVFGVCVLGLHVLHGVQSAFRTLGLENDRFAPLILGLSRLFAALMALGYSALPLYAYLFAELPDDA